MNLSLPCVGAALALGCASSVDGAHASDAGVIDVGASDVPLGPIPGCPAAQGPRGRWASVALPDDFAAREDPAALSAGDALIVYGGRGERTDLSDAWRYLPRTDRWERLPDSGLAGPARALAVAWVAARGELFVWSGFRRVGARWSASAGWRPLPTAGAPTSFATRAVVAGGFVLVAGADAPGDHNEFVRYDPAADRWDAVLAPREQTVRGSFAFVSLGDTAMVFGGTDGTTDTGVPRNDGWRVHVPSLTWSGVAREGAPTPRWGHGAWWTGDAALVWGGNDGSISLHSGARYFAGPDAWVAMPAAGSPGPVDRNAGSYDQSAAWTGGDLYAWTLTAAGEADAARFDPRAGRWFPADPPLDAARHHAAATAWHDCALYVVGGQTRVDGRPVGLSREVARWTP
ncbi:MAG: kelch repeat-containing protein [Polyangiales bacterium]